MAQSTPEMTTLELPKKLDNFLRKLGSRLFEPSNEKPGFDVKGREAFAICLAAAGEDTKVAIRLLDELVDALDEWNGVHAAAASQPFPAP